MVLVVVIIQWIMEEEKKIEYEKWTVQSLRAELLLRNLSTKGKKADLVQSLREDDLHSNTSEKKIQKTVISPKRKSLRQKYEFLSHPYRMRVAAAFINDAQNGRYPNLPSSF